MKQLLTFKTAVISMVLFVLALPAFALEKMPYSEAKLAELQEAGEVVVVDVFATWCPTCAKQQEIFKKYSEKFPENKLNVLIIDYDANKDLVEKYNAPRQSTLILFKGEKQLWYSVAEKDYSVIEAELNKAF